MHVNSKNRRFESVKCRSPIAPRSLSILRISLLVFNALVIKGVQLSGGSRSVFSKKENANAVLIVAS